MIKAVLHQKQRLYLNLDADVDVEMSMSRFPNGYCYHDWKARLSSFHSNSSDKQTLFMACGEGPETMRKADLFYARSISQFPMSKIVGSSYKDKNNYLSLKKVWKTRSFCAKTRLQLNSLVLIKKRFMQKTQPKGYRFEICL